MRTILMRMPAFTIFSVLVLASALLSGCGGSSGGGANSEAIAFRVNTVPVTAPAQYALFVGTSEAGPTTNLSPMSNLNGDVDAQYRISPDKKWVAYLADAETDQLFELYVSRLDGSVIGQKISPTAINSTRTIDNIVWSPDSTQVAYVADQEITGTWELYVSTVNGAIGVKVSADPQTGREGNTDVIRRGDTDDDSSDVVQWAPDGSRLAYIADWETDQVFELYTTTPDGNQDNVVKISDTGGKDQSIPWRNKRESFAWAPDSSKIAYRADSNTTTESTLYIADPTASTPSLLVSAYYGGQNVDEFAWAPNSSYLAYSTNDESLQVGLYTIKPEGGGVIEVSGPFYNVKLWHIGYFAWAPDSSRLAYSADQNTEFLFELYTTFPDEAGNETLVSGASTYAGLSPRTDKAREFLWSPDSSYIAYLSYQQTYGVQDLFASKADGSSNVKLSAMTVSRYVMKFSWSPDSSHVAYIGGQNGEALYELFASPIAGARETTDADGGGPASNPRLNPDLVAGGDVDINYLQWSKNSQRVFYYADQEVDGQVEFFSSTRDGSANNVKISAPLAISFANHIYPLLTADYCDKCHYSTSTYPWYAANASDTYTNMSNSGYFNNNFIVDKLNSTHGNGPYNTLAWLFSNWISEGANNN
jgi:hypothetical protein